MSKSKLEKLDDLKERGILKWLLLGLTILGSVLFIFLGDKRSAKLLMNRKKEIHKQQKDAKIDIAVASKEAIEKQSEKIAEVHKEFDEMRERTKNMNEDETFAEWEKRSR